MCLKAGYNQKFTSRQHFQNLTFILFKVSAESYSVYFPTQPKQLDKQSRFLFTSTVFHMMARMTVWIVLQHMRQAHQSNYTLHVCGALQFKKHFHIPYLVMILIMILWDWQGKVNIPTLEVRKLRLRERPWWPKVILSLAGQGPGSEQSDS